VSVPAAYIGVILIWSTTPLAIQWSVIGSSFLFGLMARLVVGVLLCLALLRLMRIAFPWHLGAVRLYLAAGLGIYGGLLTVYWGAQYIPSGLIAVIFGLTPLATGVMAAVWLGEQALTLPKVAGTLLGLAGLSLIFEAGRQWENGSWVGIAAMLISMLIHSASSVWVKRLGDGIRLHPMAINGGALVVAASLSLLTWLGSGDTMPVTLSLQTAGSILYLGIAGSVVGFTLYYHILRHLPAGVIALITLVTPVLALLLGQWLNGERVEPRIWWGTAVILAGLLLYQWSNLTTRR